MKAKTETATGISPELYHRYLEHLINGNSAICVEIVNGLLEQQIDIQTLYIELFQKSLYEIGALWEQNKISVAREHLATAITDRAMNLVYAQLFANALPHRKKATISCAANEFHQIGGKMVADLLEMRNWDTHFLGANTPVEHLIRHLHEESVSLVGLSLSVYFNMPSLLEMIQTIRDAFPDLDIIVGGQAFRFGGTEHLSIFSHVTYCDSIARLDELVGQGNVQ
ncbi:MAG: cobalamin-dependent protein [Deltaproteobacteria bacterium]|nr:cobalamin-dependent protein [Deltaproteobacteria bacterium]